MENEFSDDKIVVYEVFENFMYASIIKGVLESNNISCFLSDEYNTTINLLYNQSSGGVKLHVFEKDLELIQEIMQSKPISDNEDNLEV